MPHQRRALLLSGSGRYADPWHSFEDTTRRIAAILQRFGYVVEIADDVDATLGKSPRPDLLVTNVGLPRDGNISPALMASSGLTTYLLSGRPLFGFHASATSFTDSTVWGAALGGRWKRGTTMHPPQDHAQIHLHANPITAGLSDFVVFDERYSYLDISPTSQILATHIHDDVSHPVVWAREAEGKLGRAAYDALGHDARSFDSQAHVDLIDRLLEWAHE